MGGFIFSHSLSIDDEVLLTNNDYLLRFAQGRFLIGLLDLFVPHRVTSFYPYLLLACSYLVSHTILLGLHGLRHHWQTHIAYLLFILFPTNWLTQEFAVNVAGFAVGLVITCLAALQTQCRLLKTSQEPKRSFIPGHLFSPVVIALLVMAIGGFQSLITLYAAICLGMLLFQQSGSPTSIPANKPMTLGTGLGFILANAAAAVLIHTFILKIFLQITKVDVHQINVYFRNPYFMLRTQPSDYILGNLQQLARTYFTPGYYYGSSLFAFTLLLLGAALLYAKGLKASPRPAETMVDFRKGWQVALVGLLLVLAPLGLNVVSAPNRIPMRALMALPYMAWLASSVWLTFTAARRSVLFRMGVALSCLLILQSVIAVSDYYAARAMTYRSDQLVASTIASAIIQSQQGRTHIPVTQLASQGALKRNIPYGTAWYSTAGGSFFNWDGGNTGRIVSWLEALGIHGLKPVSDESRAALQSSLDAMRPWPAPGSIQVSGNTVLVKLGEQP